MNVTTNLAARCGLIFALSIYHVSLGPGRAAGEEAKQEQTLFTATMDALSRGVFPPQHSLLILQHNELLVEKYWSGEDLVYGVKTFRDFGPDELHGTRSCTKSVVGLLVGMAIDEGILPAIETPAFTLFRDLRLEAQGTFSDAHRRITLRHLLTMTDGLDWQQYDSKDHVNNESELERSANAAAYVWSQPMKRRPGEAFNYNSGATALLARSLRRASGADVEQFAAKRLFSPLQITNWEWLKDNDGEPAAHFGLRLRPRDMVKIGQLVLQKGSWKGDQVVPKSWIEAMAHRGNKNPRYGYQWWLEDFSVGNQTVKAIVAYGRGGQSIFVLPEQEAVVVLTAGHYDDNKSAGARKELLRKAILPELLARP